MKFRIANDSLFAILLGSPWWISIVIAAGIIAAARLVVPDVYAFFGALPFPWLVLGLEARAAGDPARGSKVFQACMACHSVKPGEHMTGPSLAHIWNRKAGTVEDFLRYSDSMKKLGVMWNDATLDKWLANPQRFLPGTSMTFAGIREDRDRQDVIAYLQSVSEGKAPAGARQGAMGDKPDLKKAPPEGQVTAIDSGKDGPAPGKPVIVGAGMQGDRASVIFAGPAEISSFIKLGCQ